MPGVSSDYIGALCCAWWVVCLYRSTVLCLVGRLTRSTVLCRVGRLTRSTVLCLVGRLTI